jgi:hypothetical protein
MDLVAFCLELLFQQKAEYGGVRRVGLGFAFDRRLVLRRIGEKDRRVAGTDVGKRRVFLDPIEDVASVVVELLKL